MSGCIAPGRGSGRLALQSSNVRRSLTPDPSFRRSPAPSPGRGTAHLGPSHRLGRVRDCGPGASPPRGPGDRLPGGPLPLSRAPLGSRQPFPAPRRPGTGTRLPGRGGLSRMCPTPPTSRRHRRTDPYHPLRGSDAGRVAARDMSAASEALDHELAAAAAADVGRTPVPSRAAPPRNATRPSSSRTASTAASGGPPSRPEASARRPTRALVCRPSPLNPDRDDDEGRDDEQRWPRSTTPTKTGARSGRARGRCCSASTTRSSPSVRRTWSSVSGIAGPSPARCSRSARPCSGARRHPLRAALRLRGSGVVSVPVYLPPAGPRHVLASWGA